MPAPLMTGKAVACVNSYGRQASSFIRVAAALGWRVRAQLVERNAGLIAEEICNTPGVEVVEGSLEDDDIINTLFDGCQVAFVNTTHWGDEVGIGIKLADAAKRAGVQHYVFSSMPDHSTFGRGWKAIPLWARKSLVENHVREIGLPATFVYTGIYNNNFTSLNYPLFKMALQDDGGFVWAAPFAPDEPLPWLDAEHDVGPAVLQIFIDGPRKWAGKTVPLAFEHLTPNQVCHAFSLGLSRPVTYVRGPISIEVPVPAGYREHLEILQETLGEKGAPFFGPELEADCIRRARELWEAPRGMEEYAREIFPIEERANGMGWMDEEVVGEGKGGMDTPRRDRGVDAWDFYETKAF